MKDWLVILQMLFSVARIIKEAIDRVPDEEKVKALQELDQSFDKLRVDKDATAINDWLKRNNA